MEMTADPTARRRPTRVARPGADLRKPDPVLPKGRKKLLPTVISSLLAIGIISYVKGDLPQIDHFFSQLNEMAQSHNDEVVGALIHWAPEALLLMGVLGVGALVVSGVRGRRARG